MRRIVLIAAAMVAFSAAGCGQGAKTDGKQGAEEQADRGGRPYGRERFTIVVRHTGITRGTSTLHVREWGARQATITDTTTDMAAMSAAMQRMTAELDEQMADLRKSMGADIGPMEPSMSAPKLDKLIPARNRSQTVVEGSTSVTINQETGKGLRISAPAMVGRPVEETLGALAGGLQRTGERGSYAGHRCEFWASPQTGDIPTDMRVCITPWGAALYVRTTIAGAADEATAVQVRMNDGGPDSAFRYDASKVEDMKLPDLGAMAPGSSMPVTELPDLQGAIRKGD